ncbi:MAG TPA: ferritin-like domain-containing protein [Terriglobales bacterium]|nr:ferritin-like domain-containing protein [Terriglobales bacterium]
MPEFVKDIEDLRRRAMQDIQEGAVTQAYQADKERTIKILNEALATEIVCVLRYMHHYFMATGVHGKGVAEEFKEHADSEREHADEIGERIQQLGGKPDFNPGTLVQRSVAQYVEGETLADMIREDLIAERSVIEVYSEMVRYFGDKDPTTRILLEHILAEEEEHASDLVDLLYIVDPATGRDRGIDPGTDALAISRGERGNEQQQPRERSASAEVQQPLGADQGRVEPFAGRGTAVPAEVGRVKPSEAHGEMRPARATGSQRPDASDASPEHQPGATGRPQRQRPEQTAVADVDDAVDEGGQRGTTRAVRVTKPNRKKRVA